MLHQDADIRIIPGDPGRWDFVDAAHVTRYEWAAPFLSSMTIRSVLDAGCGSGYGVALLARRFPDKRFLGADASAAAVAHARTAFGRLPNASFRVADLRVPAVLPEGGFDAVLSFDVIEHISDCVRYVDGLFRVLRPGGLLLCATPNRSTRWDYSDKENPFHAHEFTRDELVATLGATFRVEAILGQHVANERRRRYHIDNHSLATLPGRTQGRRTMRARLRRYVDRRLLRLHRFRPADIAFRPDTETAFGLVVVARRAE